MAEQKIEVALNEVANTTVAKIRSAEVSGNGAISNMEQKAFMSSPSKVREFVNKNKPNKKVDLEHAHNTKVFTGHGVYAETDGVTFIDVTKVETKEGIGDGDYHTPVESYDGTGNKGEGSTFSQVLNDTGVKSMTDPSCCGENSGKLGEFIGEMKEFKENTKQWINSMDTNQKIQWVIAVVIAIIATIGVFR